MNPKAIQTRLEHKNIETTMNICSKCTQKMQADTIDILEDILQKQINCPPCPQQIIAWTNGGQ